MQDAGRQQVLSLPGVVFQGRSIVHLLLFSSPPIHVSMMLGTKIRGLESAMEKSTKAKPRKEGKGESTSTV
ncbi:Uncharacterized protein TCM_003034 [Theobroma cacao]|uniref:Uncharacterized protein n=1 Tax=Theobroma cacao TaxID=3641 RepID=A0A061DMG0_THECC|nr:Uncharacterized protein TCM_003034 [Theobroma cacao]